jgi:P27 family predicted phage terminase small subunit
MDVSALTQYCLAWSMLLRSQQELDERGLMLTTPHYDKEGNHLYDEVDINPATKTWKAANETLFKCIDRLGLAPSTRTRLQLPKKVDAASKFAGLIGRGN